MFFHRKRKKKKKSIVKHRKLYVKISQCAITITSNALLLSALSVKDLSQAEQWLPGNGRAQWCWEASWAEHIFSNNVLFSIFLLIFCTWAFFFFNVVCVLFFVFSLIAYLKSYNNQSWHWVIWNWNRTVGNNVQSPVWLALEILYLSPCCHLLCLLPCLCFFQVWPCQCERERNVWGNMVIFYKVPFSTQSNVMYSKVSYIFWTDIILWDILEVWKGWIFSQKNCGVISPPPVFSRLHPCVVFVMV